MVTSRQLLTVTTLHGTDITLVGGEPSFYRITKFCIEASDAVTAVSDHLKARTRESFDTRKEIEVIPNFIDGAKFRPDGATVSKQFFCPKSQPMLMHISNFRPVKNISTVIQVFSRVRSRVDARLVLVGDGPERLPAEKLCAQLGVEDDVLFLGNQECIEGILPLADVLLLPSEQESFGLVCLEAISCGVPVVATNVGGTKEVIQHGQTGFLHDPFDVEAMVASVMELIDDPGRRRSMGALGRKVATEKFSTADIVKRYVDLYERVCATGRPSQ
jgi:N-acetyl-alpha-D-glucosaminyl L-malate synthase BshA